MSDFDSVTGSTDPAPTGNGTWQPSASRSESSQPWARPRVDELDPDETSDVRLRLDREPEMRIDVAISFLKHFHPVTPWALACFGPGKNEVGPARTFDPSEEQAARQFLRRVQGKHNVYFAVNCVSGRPAKKVKKRDIAEIHWLHVDADLSKALDWSDAAGVAAEKARVLEKLRAYNPPPTAINWSGGGFQGFWRLSEIERVEGDLTRMELIEDRMKVIEKAIDADACNNVDRHYAAARHAQRPRRHQEGTRA